MLRKFTLILPTVVLFLAVTIGGCVSGGKAGNRMEPDSSNVGRMEKYESVDVQDDREYQQSRDTRRWEEEQKLKRERELSETYAPALTPDPNGDPPPPELDAPPVGQVESEKEEAKSEFSEQQDPETKSDVSAVSKENADQK